MVHVLKYSDGKANELVTDSPSNLGFPYKRTPNQNLKDTCI